jgi:RNA polymerase sigma-70 factor, ECF subfamily
LNGVPKLVENARQPPYVRLTGGPVDASGQVSDAILVEAARDGDLEAFEAIVRRHQATIYQVAQRLLDSPADAQDVTQDTFVRAWRGLAGFRGDSAVSTWLYRIVTRRCLDVLATRRPTQELAEDVETIADEPPDRVELRERLRAVTRAIATLPAEQRVALTLREFEGLSYQEVADILGVGVPAVKGRIHRARLAVMGQTTAWR